MVCARYFLTPHSQRMPPRELPGLADHLSATQPYTIRRLRGLKPGERIVYYRGHFGFDLDRTDVGTIYRDLLVRIRETAQQLASHRKAVLSEIKRFGPTGEVYYDYVATGV